MSFQIFDISLMLKCSSNIINKMKILSSKNEYNQDDIEWFRIHSIELTNLLNKLKTIDPIVISKIRKRQSKRRRQKKIREINKSRKQNRNDREKEIDEWLEKVKCDEQEEEKKKKEKLQLQKKLSEIERQINLLNNLEKLDKAKGGTADVKSTKLLEVLHQVRSSIEKSEDDVIVEKCNQYLFSTPGNVEIPPETLFRIRTDWDRFISNDDNATSIPVGWATPKSEFKQWHNVDSNDTNNSV